jgi:hypothetical protein
MKNIRMALFGMVSFFGMAFAAPQERTFRGEIMDTQCAKMGSHEVMMKKAGARDVAECTRDCVKMGGKYVLYDAATKTTYQLDDQRTPERFAGQRVNVKGDYDAARKQIQVASIQPTLVP